MGKQSCGSQQYEVQVDLKHVDMSESFLCGYLRIKGSYASKLLLLPNTDLSLPKALLTIIQL